MAYVFGKLRRARRRTRSGSCSFSRSQRNSKQLSTNDIIKFFRFTFTFDRTAITFGFVPAFRMKMTFSPNRQQPARSKSGLPLLPFSRCISWGHIRAAFHRSSKQFKALQDNLNVQLFVVTDEARESQNQVRTSQTIRHSRLDSRRRLLEAGRPASSVTTKSCTLRLSCNALNCLLDLGAPDFGLGFR